MWSVYCMHSDFPSYCHGTVRPDGCSVRKMQNAELPDWNINQFTSGTVSAISTSTTTHAEGAEEYEPVIVPGEKAELPRNKTVQWKYRNLMAIVFQCHRIKTRNTGKGSMIFFLFIHGHIQLTSWIRQRFFFFFIHGHIQLTSWVRQRIFFLFWYTGIFS
jgi:hypothetical protein